MKVLLRFFAVFSLMSCINSNSNNQETFWEGAVKPGTYNLSWRESSAYGENANKITFELVIFDNHEFEIRKKTECGLDRVYYSDIVTMEGTIEKRCEVYDGQEKVWFALNGTNSDNRVEMYSIIPSGNFYCGANQKWKYIKENCSVGKIH